METDENSGDGTAAARYAARIRDRAIVQRPLHRRLIRSAQDGRRLSDLMLPLFVGISAAAGQGVLTTTGRRTGRSRRTCLRIVRRGDRAYAVMLRPPSLAVERPTALAAWIWNLRADPVVRVQLGRRTYDGSVREITDPAELEVAREAFCESFYRIDYGECVLHLRGWPTRAKVMALHRYWFETGVPLVIDIAR